MSFTPMCQDRWKRITKRSGELAAMAGRQSVCCCTTNAILLRRWSSSAGAIRMLIFIAVRTICCCTNLNLSAHLVTIGCTSDSAIANAMIGDWRLC